MSITNSILFALVGFCSIACQPEAKSDHDNSFQELSEKFPESCIISGRSEQKLIGLTFDDGPSEVTKSILEILDSLQVKATFFWQGKNLIEHQEIVLSAFHSGHEIGNHSWDHPNGYETDEEVLWKNQVLPTNQLFDSLFGINISYFRPPFGAINENQVRFLTAQDQKTILWSLTTLDWDTTQNSATEILSRVKKEMKPGDIILMHDVDFGHTVNEKLQAIHRIIAYARSRGYEFVTVSELIHSNQ